MLAGCVPKAQKARTIRKGGSAGWVLFPLFRLLTFLAVDQFLGKKKNSMIDKF